MIYCCGRVLILLLTFLAFVAGLAVRTDGVALLALVLVASAAHRKRTLVARNEHIAVVVKPNWVTADLTEVVIHGLVSVSQLQAKPHVWLVFQDPKSKRPNGPTILSFLPQVLKIHNRVQLQNSTSAAMDCRVHD